MTNIKEDFFNACSKGDIVQVKDLLGSFMFNSNVNKNYDALIYAIKYPEIVKYLFDNFMNEEPSLLYCSAIAASMSNKNALDLVQHILKSSFIENSIEKRTEFIKQSTKYAIDNDNLDLMKYLCGQGYNKDILSLNKNLVSASTEGSIEIVKYLLTSPDLDIHADIKYESEDAFIQACWNNHIEIVKYLLTSPALKEHASINIDDSAALNVACSSGNIEIVMYLLDSPDLKEHADIYLANFKGFYWACDFKYYNIIDYFILHHNISPPIEGKSGEGYDYALKVIKRRDLNQKLNDTLPEGLKNKKIKV